MAEASAAGHVPSLYRGVGAQRYHDLSRQDDTEIVSVLSFLEILPDQALAGLRVLELACGSGRVTLPMAGTECSPQTSAPTCSAFSPSG